MASEIKALLIVAALVAGCAERPAAAGEAPVGKEESRMERKTNGEGEVRDLPSSFGRSFASLDEYLEHLRRYAGPIDLPWYREIRPGVYEYVTSVRLEEGSQSGPRTYTREALMRQFGFTR